MSKSTPVLKRLPFGTVLLELARIFPPDAASLRPADVNSGCVASDLEPSSYNMAW